MSSSDCILLYVTKMYIGRAGPCNDNTESERNIHEVCLREKEGQRERGFGLIPFSCAVL